MAIFLRCDKCGTDFDGEPHHPKGFKWGSEHQLREEARARGWKMKRPSRKTAEDPWPTSFDLCPTCAVQPTGPKEAAEVK